ncbi:hypothetical protein ABZV78_03260 [Micromonospora sp. NPDC004540]|uniref:hypothetical protein n=1 Tax=Micromonospora sp. NPDC004540 TaxID=3154457 RepID=UPI0033BA55DB
MSGVERSFRSPLTLLEQWRDRVDAARLREVVITGYTVDLGFLEKFAIPTARALGARITILGDAVQAVHDPVDVRRAGVAYQHGHAACQRAFHPKLVVLLGDEDVWLAIGSGNPTLSGWGYNRELWAVARGSRQQGPQLIADVADWLHDLPEVVRMATWIAATLRQVAERIRPATLDGQWSQVRAHGNLRRPLLEQVPTEPVRALHLSAPFYDPPARAVTDLVRRTKPESVRVAVQPGVGIFDGAALVRATENVVDREFAVLVGGPVRHGKLIEWCTADGAIAGLTGSANVTTSALLLSTVGGGNCELVVLAPQDGSLFPPGDRQPGSAVGKLVSSSPTSPADTGRPGPVLLGCALADGALLVELAAPMTAPVLVETSPSAVPGTWLGVGTVPVGQAAARFLVPELTGGAVRAVVEVDSVRHESAVVFVTDTSRCRPRKDAANEPRLPRSYDPVDLFTDPVIAQRFSADLERLTVQVGAAARNVPHTTGKRVDVPVGSSDRWADFLEDCDRLLGPDLSRLVFPRNEVAETDTSIVWSIDDADQGEVADGEDESVLDDVTQEEAAAGRPAVSAVPPDERNRYRRFAARWVAAVAPPARPQDGSTPPPMPLRMTITALYLTLLAAGVWQDEETWRKDLRRLAGALVPDDQTLDELPPEAFHRLYSLLAVAMATLRQDAQLYGGRAEDAVATAAWRDTAEWVAEADPKLAEDLLLPATQPYARVVSSAALWDTITLARQSRHDPYAAARMALAEAGVPVECLDGVWHVEGEHRNAYRTAALVATALQRVADQVVAVARAPDRAVLIAAAGHTMALADSRMAVWRLYELSSTRTPTSLTAGHPGPPPGARTRPLVPSPLEVRELSARLGIDLVALTLRLRTT